MQRLAFTVAVDFVKTEDDTMLVVRDKDGQEAAFLFSDNTEPIGRGILEKWAAEKIQECLKSRRERTGAVDSYGNMMYEGDIIQCNVTTQHGEVQGTGMVKYHDTYAAFIIEGRFAGGPGAGGWGTVNLAGSRNMTVVGNIFENPDLLVETPKTVKAEDENIDYLTRGGREPEPLKSYD